MWTFDRYQRWIEQKSDWVRPAARTAASASAPEMVKIVKVPRPAAAAPGSSLPSPNPATAATPSAGTSPAPDSSSEITIDEELDLNELAELARKIEERTR
jgi:twitching motility protein PilT